MNVLYMWCVSPTLCLPSWCLWACGVGRKGEWGLGDKLGAKHMLPSSPVPQPALFGLYPQELGKQGYAANTSSIISVQVTPDQGLSQGSV